MFDGPNSYRPIDDSSPLPIRIELLGPFRVFDGYGNQMEPLQGRVNDLLAVMVVTSTSLSRSQMASELWGGEPTSSADNAVRSYLAILKDLADPAIFRRTGLLYPVQRDRVHSDWDEFEGSVTAARSFARATNFSEAAVHYEAALRLWRGEPFHGLRPLQRLESLTRRAKELFDLAEEEYGAVLLQLGRHEANIERFVLATERRPTRERRWEQLMLALYRAKRQTEACEVYSTARKAVVERAGLDPSKSLHELYVQILHQAPDLDLVSLSPERPGIPAWVVAATERAVGRELERSQLGTFVSMVVGPSASGKSTLLAQRTNDDLIELAESERFDVMHVGFEPHLSTGTSPFQLAVFSAASDTDQPLTPEYLLNGVRQRCDIGQVVLVVDDLQWCDDTSLLVLKHLIRNPLSSLRIRIGARPSDASAAIGRLSGVSVVHLEPMTDSEINLMVDAMQPTLTKQGVTVSLDQRQAAIAAGKGRPLVVELLLRTVVWLNDELQTEQPEAIGALVRRLVNSLPSRSQDLLHHISVMGNPFNLDACAQDLAASDEEIRQALDDGIRLGLLSSGILQFAHSSIGEAVYRSLPPSERLARHELLFKNTNLLTDEQAVHALSASTILDTDTILTICEAGRRIATTAGRWSRVVAIAEREIELRNHRNVTPNMFDVLVDLAEALERLGKSAETIRDQAMLLAQQSGNSANALRAAGIPPLSGRSIEPTASSLSRLARALSVVGRPARRNLDTNAVLLHAERVSVTGIAGLDVSLAAESFNVIERVASSATDPHHRAIALRSWLSGHPGSANQLDWQTRLAELVELATGTEDRQLLAESLSLLIRAHLVNGQLSDASSVLEQHARVCTRPSDHWTNALARSTILTTQGYLTEGADAAVEAALFGARFAINDFRPSQIVQQSVLKWVGGPDIESRLPVLVSVGVTESESTEVLGTRRWVAYSLAAMQYAQLGDITNANRLVDLTADLFPTKADWFAPPAAAWITEACWILRRNIPTQITNCLIAVGQRFVVVGLAPAANLGPAARYVAMAASLAGSAEAVSLFESARELSETAGAVIWEQMILSSQETHYRRNNLLEAADEIKTFAKRLSLLLS
jgi:DNA-binding SARP family transcriptional activator